MKLQEAYLRMRAKHVALKAMGLLPLLTPKYPARRYMEKTAWFDPAVWWDKDRKGIAYVPTTGERTAGLRFVGVVCGGRGGHANWRDGTINRNSQTGWYTNDDAIVYRDGSGLMWGVVYQLPGRKGMARYVAGYQVGGVDDGPVLDLGRIYECKVTGGPSWTIDTHETEAAINASAQADRMAAQAADDEREYQRENSESLDEEDAA